MTTGHKEVILHKVQREIKRELLNELSNTKHYTGHSLVIKDIEDVKSNIINYTMNLLDKVERSSFRFTPVDDNKREKQLLLLSLMME